MGLERDRGFAGAAADRLEIIRIAITSSMTPCAQWATKDQFALADEIEELLRDAEGPIQD